MSRLTKTILVLAVVAGCAWLQFLLDDGVGSSWPAVVVRNWQQFGLFELHGKLVTNIAGFGAVASPVVYGGMSPVCLYPAYFTAQIFAWTGLDTMAFQILMAALVFWAVWRLLGRDDFAMTVAAVALLCPGYGRWLKILDPNVITVLFGLPYIAIVVSILKKPRLGAAAVAGLLGLTLAFVSLNWTTAWVLGPCALLLLGLPQINRRAAILFIVLAGACSFLFVLVSALMKAGGGHVGTGNLGAFIRGYTWGNVGYGLGLTTGKAFVRLGFVNLVALLPLFVAGGVVAAKHFRLGDIKSWFALSPLALAGLDICIMRNYFGHHPWMAAPVLLVGLIFFMVLLRSQTEVPAATTERKTGGLLLPATALVCFLYGLTVVGFFRANELNGLALAGLVSHHTARADCLVIVKNLDPQTAEIAPQISYNMDRRVLVVDDLTHLPADESRLVILSAVPAGGTLKLRAQGGSGAGSQPLMQKACAWFNRVIARRRPGDRTDYAGTYYLYETKS